MFINGELDIIGQSMVDILGNNASLQLFKDVTFQGKKLLSLIYINYFLLLTV